VNPLIFRDSFKKISGDGWIIALLLLGVTGIMRLLGIFVEVLLFLSFLSYVLIFFLFVRRESWREAGWTSRFPRLYLPLGALSGIGTTLLSYGICYAAFGNSNSNWYVELANSLPERTLISLVGFTLIMMTMSPFTEELFFRGVMQTSLRKRFPLLPTLFLINVPWGIVHISQFGVHVTDGVVVFNLALTAGLMLSVLIGGFVSGLLFEKSKSLIPSMISHSVGNLVTSFLAFTILT